MAARGSELTRGGARDPAETLLGLDVLIGRDKKGKRDLQDLNLRGYYPVDFTDSVNSVHISYAYLVFKFFKFESTALTTRPKSH